MHRKNALIGLAGLAILAIGIALWPRGGDGGDASAEDLADAAATLPADLPRYGDWGAGAAAYAESGAAGAEPVLAKEVAEGAPERKAQALYFLGCCQWDLGRKDDASRTWRTLLADHPESPYGGDALYRLGNHEEAFERYPASDGGRRAAAGLAEGYRSRGESGKAIRAYSAILAGGGEEARELEAKRALDELLRGGWKAAFAAGEEHVVQPGDSLWKIARKLGTTPGFLRFVNGKSSDNLRVGERLVVARGEFVIRVWKSNHILRLFVDDVFVREYVVGLGSGGCTPVGEFRIATRKENPPWYYDGKVIPYGDPRNILGTRWMGFENKPGATGYGIHGTAFPESIGKDESSGCVRMYNDQVEELFDLVPIGARVVIAETR